MTINIRTISVRELSTLLADALPTAEVEQTTGTGRPPLHYYWPSEFPVAVCGALSTLDRLPPPGTVQVGEVCAECERLHALGNQRRNPHAGGGTP